MYCGKFNFCYLCMLWQNLYGRMHVKKISHHSFKRYVHANFTAFSHFWWQVLKGRFFSCVLDYRMTNPRSSWEVPFRSSLDVFTACSLGGGGEGWGLTESQVAQGGENILGFIVFEGSTAKEKQSRTCRLSFEHEWRVLLRMNGSRFVELETVAFSRLSARSKNLLDNQTAIYWHTDEYLREYCK